MSGVPRALLEPRSVAVIGASAGTGFAGTTLQNVVEFGFAGAIYPVNPRHAELAGLTCYPSVGAVPGPVDLALIVVPAAAVLPVLQECAAAGVGAAIVYASGFAELGEQGRAAQDRMRQIAVRSGMRVLGPNCMGLFDQSSGLVASFTGSLRGGLLPPSPVAYVGQSGAIGGAVLGMSRERGIGLTAWFSTGNEADLSAAEIAAGLVERAEIGVVAVYLESIPDGAVWQQVTGRAADLGKQVVVLRSGLSAAGRRAIASHTGAMVRPDAAFALLNSERGIIEVADVDELVNTIQALVAARLHGRWAGGPAVAVVTSSGGVGSIMADQLEPSGLTLAELKPQTQAALAPLIPDYGSTANPVDVTAQLFTLGAEAFEAACRPLLDDEGVDALSIVMTTITGERAVQIAEGIVRLAGQTAKPVGVVWLASLEETWQARQVLNRAGVPVGSSVPGHVRVLRNLLVRPARPGESEPPGPAAADEPLLAELLAAAEAGTEAGGARLLDALGIARPEAILATSEDEAVAAAGMLGGGRLVFKIQSPQIAHKSDVGGVVVDVDPADAARAFREVLGAGERVPGARIDGVLVQRMAPPGTELIVGISGSRDGYPPVLTVGMGGLATEVYADVVSALAPVGPDEAHALLRRLRGWPLLDGYRGRPKAAAGAVVGAVVALSQAAVLLGERLEELEINPLAVDEHGALALDLLIRRRCTAPAHEEER